MTLRPYSATLQAAYRDTLGTPGAPETIDDSSPVVPVAVVAQVNTASTAGFVQVTDGTDTLQIVSTSYGYGALTYSQTEALKTGVGFAAGTTGQVIKQFQGGNANSGVDTTFYTPTAGKTFYLTSFWGSQNNAAIVDWTLKDNATAKVDLRMPTGLHCAVHLTTPIAFSTAVVVNQASGGVVTWVGGFAGFEQ